MIARPLREFIDRMIDNGEMRDEDVFFLRRDICPDGIVSRSEADALIALDRIVAVPPSWGDFLVQSLLSFTLTQMSATGTLPHDFTNWLISSLDIGYPTERAVRVAAAVVSEARCVDDYLRRFAKISVDEAYPAGIRSAA